MVVSLISIFLKHNISTKPVTYIFNWRSSLFQGEDHPICPVMLSEEKLATQMANKMLGKNNCFFNVIHLFHYKVRLKNCNAKLYSIYKNIKEYLYFVK